jgi:hypothetical protein
MERVIYSPTLEDLPEAEELARQTMLPILIGDSLSTESLDFNRSSVQVVEIPRVKEMHVSANYFKFGMHQTVIVFDEFCGENISQYSAVYAGKKLSPMYMEKHRAKWSFVCDKEGQSSVLIFFNDEQVEELKFDVY